MASTVPLWIGYFSEPECSEWSIFSSCSKTCGPGTQSRSRTCNHYVGGKDYIQYATENRECLNKDCSIGMNLFYTTVEYAQCYCG